MSKHMEKILVTGKITRVDGNKVHVQEGNAVAVYSTDYYRVVEG